MPSDDVALQTFVADRYPRLRRSAFLMGGDWELAGEQARATLTRLVTDSDRGHVDDGDAYAWSDLMHSCRHRPRKREHVFVAAPDGEGEALDTILVLDALHRLAPRCRSVLVLRQFDGFTVEETADLLGLSDERVEAYEAAGLGALEVLLADTIPAPEPPAEEPVAGTPGQDHTQRSAAEVPGPEHTPQSAGESGADVLGQEPALQAVGESAGDLPGRERTQRSVGEPAADVAGQEPALPPAGESGAAGQESPQFAGEPAAEVSGRKQHTQVSAEEPGAGVPGQDGAAELAADVPGREPAQRPGGGPAQESTGEAGTATAENR